MVKPLKKIESKQSQKVMDKSVKEDAFMEKSYAARDYFLNNKEMFQKYGIVVAIVAAVLIFMAYNSKESSKRANSQLGIALIDLRAEKLELAENKFSLIIDEFSGTDAAARAHYYLGNISLKKDLITVARDHYNQANISDPLFASAAKAGLALCAEKESNYSEAAKLYEEASQNESREEIKAKYLFSAGINYELAQNSTKAKSIYQSIVDDYDSFSQKALVEVKLAKL